MGIKEKFLTFGVFSANEFDHSKMEQEEKPADFQEYVSCLYSIRLF